ncbi:YesL family protein [Falsibacillus albus]|uniref:DUF624 domain-containing protein n=1 Tax=Falsibacillus albus TaxID=2478915 RepID=A0A3L7JVZ8_9BACI|nr:DUF624 domain-containing protein [Falsibacillus albus]RLQ94289.1 DUF624 domain-containing protein [Falsibacillus albus]
MPRLTGGLYTVMEWITRLVYLQFLWTVFLIFGLGVLGIFPSTFAMFAVARQWIRRQEDLPMTKYFWQMYRRDWLMANLIGWGMTAGSFILYFYHRLFLSFHGVLPFIISVLLLVVMAVYTMMLIMVIPVYVHYRLRWKEFIKCTALIAVSHPFHVAAIASVLFAGVLLLKMVPGFLPFFSVSPVCLAVMWLAHLAFQRIEKSRVMLIN